jgi:hypothetical protein
VIPEVYTIVIYYVKCSVLKILKYVQEYCINYYELFLVISYTKQLGRILALNLFSDFTLFISNKVSAKSGYVSIYTVL